jgi:hypothetical protein
VAGKCAACAKNQDDFCLSHQATCSAGGQCLHALDGTSRCGVGSLSFTCDLCTDDIDCDQGTGSGRFCARSTGPNCPCPAGQTFCARLP